MGGTRVGILGTEAIAQDRSVDDDVLAGGDPPGSLGIDSAQQMSTLTIADVRKDWNPDSAEETDILEVAGATIDEVYKSLNRLKNGEWGQGGGRLEMTPAMDFANSQSVTLSAHLIRRLPSWRELEANNVKPAEKTAWQKMLRKLIEHEERHVAIAVEEASKLADKLVGKTLKQGHEAVTAANSVMSSRQAKLDHDTNHGAKEGVDYGDVILDFKGT
jgi:hypothetical protein